MEGPSTLFDNWTQFVKEYVWADKMSPHNTQVDRETLKKLLQYSHFTSYFVNVCHGVSLWLSFVNSLSDYEIISDIWWNVGSIFIFSPFLNNLSLSFFLIFSYDLQATYKPTWNTTACITENLMENVTRCVCPLSGTYIVLMAKRNVNVSFIYFRLSIFECECKENGFRWCVVISGMKWCQRHKSNWYSVDVFINAQMDKKSLWMTVASMVIIFANCPTNTNAIKTIGNRHIWFLWMENPFSSNQSLPFYKMVHKYLLARIHSTFLWFCQLQRSWEAWNQLSGSEIGVEQQKTVYGNEEIQRLTHIRLKIRSRYNNFVCT